MLVEKESGKLGDTDFSTLWEVHDRDGQRMYGGSHIFPVAGLLVDAVQP